MTGVAELLLRQVFTRLRAAPSWLPADIDAQNPRIRRRHRTSVPRDRAPEVHEVDGEQLPGKQKNCSVEWYCDFTVAVFVVPDDETGGNADAYTDEIYKRLDNNTVPYTLAGGTTPRFECMGIQPDGEVADGDALRVDMRFRFTYETKTGTLDEAA